MARAQTGGRAPVSGEAGKGRNDRPAQVVPSLLRAMRPKQWIKNVLVAAAPGAAHALFHERVALRTGAAFVAFCLAASGNYLLNDVRDVDADRLHPTKRFRPIASGAVPIPVALVTSVVLFAAGMVLAMLLSVKFAAVLAAYIGLTVLYSLWLKQEPVLDIAIVASGFVFRAVAGGVATKIPLSQWFLIVTAAGSLFVVAGKRHGEYMDMGEDRATTRASLASYSLAYLRYVWMLASAVGIVAYCLWAFEQSHARGFPWFELSIVPFVLALLRYALIIETGHAGAPEEVLLGDRVFLVLVASWLVVYGAGLHGAR